MATSSIRSFMKSAAAPRSSIISSAQSQATSSITRVGQYTAPATTSAFRLGRDVVTKSSMSIAGAADFDSQEIRDDIRHEYMRNRALERQEKQGVSVRTGKGFRKKKFHRGLVSMKLLDPYRYKNLSYTDLAYFEKLVKETAGLTAVGVGFSRTTKRRMKHRLWQDYRQGVVTSKEDWKDIERMIDNLPSSGY